MKEKTDFSPKHHHFIISATVNFKQSISLDTCFMLHMKNGSLLKLEA